MYEGVDIVSIGVRLRRVGIDQRVIEMMWFWQSVSMSSRTSFVYSTYKVPVSRYETPRTTRKLETPTAGEIRGGRTGAKQRETVQVWWVRSSVWRYAGTRVTDERAPLAAESSWYEYDWSRGGDCADREAAKSRAGSDCGTTSLFWQL